MSRLSDYCSFDVKVERALDKSLRYLSDEEHAVWVETEIINDRGARFDLDFVRAAREVGETTRERLDVDIKRLTNGAVVKASNVSQLKRWLFDRGVDLRPPAFDEPDPAPEPVLEDAELDEDVLLAEGKPDARDELPDLRRRDVLRLLANEDVDAVSKAALRVRLEAGKISTRKLDAIVARSDAEGIVRGLFGYHGANTGRYISHGLQVQNLPREVVPDWDECRLLLDGGPDLVDALGGAPLDMISRMLRGAIIPREGYEIAGSAISHPSRRSASPGWRARPVCSRRSAARRRFTRRWRPVCMASPPARSRKTARSARSARRSCLGAGYGWAG